MAKVKIFSNLCEKTLVLLASLYIVNNHLKFLYTKGIYSSIFINRVIKVLIIASISTSRYKFVCDGTNSRSGHVAGLTTTYVTLSNKSKTFI
jgi:hypothetical protein